MAKLQLTDRQTDIQTHAYRQTDRQTHLSDGHGAEDVEEDEGAVGDITAHQVAVRDALQQREGLERQLCHHTTIKPRQRGEREDLG